jgi:hypothetical protein
MQFLVLAAAVVLSIGAGILSASLFLGAVLRFVSKLR